MNQTCRSEIKGVLSHENIFVGQIYVEPGVSYPFSNQFQTWLGQELTSRGQPSQTFAQVYSDDFDLVFRVSAKSHITEPETKGPTLFKRDRDVEFSIFLPYQASEPNEYRRYGGRARDKALAKDLSRDNNVKQFGNLFL